MPEYFLHQSQFDAAWKAGLIEDRNGYPYCVGGVLEVDGVSVGIPPGFVNVVETIPPMVEKE